jgi:Cu/Ag efflux protein CusF
MTLVRLINVRKINVRRSIVFAAVVLGLSCLITMPPASAQNAGKKSYTFRGVVQSVDAKAGRLTVANEKIEGWMDAMTMGYAVDKPEELKGVKAGDKIEATVYDGDYKLYNIKVVGQK